MNKDQSLVTRSSEENRDSSKKRRTTDGVCSSVSDRYKKIGRLGEGTYGVVYKAMDRNTENVVALKRCLAFFESSAGFPLTTLREIRALRLLQNHTYIVTLHEVAVSNHGVFLVLECAETDLARLLDNYYPNHRKSPFSDKQVVGWIKQLLSALQCCHEHCLVHRDVKPSNLLVFPNNVLKLADMGLSRHVAPHMTMNVVSLWYRAPELLWNNQGSYTESIDLWASGCILAELWQGYPLFSEREEAKQRESLVELLGSYEQKTQTSRLWERFGKYTTAHGLDLLTHLLEYDPECRWTASVAVESIYLTKR